MSDMSSSQPQTKAPPQELTDLIRRYENFLDSHKRINPGTPEQVIVDRFVRGIIAMCEKHGIKVDTVLGEPEGE